ncbi:quaternary amine ABC transporter ATP-binding protein [Mangrovibrevibacter kandeliae]|uniref:quaternary amine ABC transporter ATP-binding protein n=1 Tax=Mangrovibrevibacter kandeliae TaxID=2968473 RepID=UPI002117B9D9|nr:glycine betaine/L-proline ABC transporter ATP-binding protein [Aurantimonas sp. CSK15Z-1]MCQ8781308.1 glycine betaine/L-proline ABC transporter ATP-binding protein [Aurantimonas sp. CSK15Z-1]
MADPAIRIRNLFKIFGPRDKALIERVMAGMTKAELQSDPAHTLGLRDINIDMRKGTIQVVMGLSGSGKSTLVRHINRLIEPTAGEILIEGEDVTAMTPDRLRAFRRRQVSMVFQRFALLPHKTVLDNVTYGLRIAGVGRSDRERAAGEWVERVGLSGYENSFPAQLSGGMQQRVGLARALATDADILLMDEPFSALDPLIRSDMQAILLELQKDLKKTVVFITHDLDEALRLGDRIAILRDGAIVQQGNPQDIVMSPADDYVAAFVAEVNRGKVVKVETIMRPLSPDSSALSARSALVEGTSLEAAARSMTEAEATEAVVLDSGGHPVGTVTMRDVIGAMVPSGDEGRGHRGAAALAAEAIG